MFHCDVILIQLWTDFCFLKDSVDIFRDYVYFLYILNQKELSAFQLFESDSDKFHLLQITLKVILKKLHKYR